MPREPASGERCPLCRHSLNITPPETVKILQKYAMRANREAQFLLGSAYQHGEYGLVRCSKKARPCDLRHSSGLLQAFGSLLMGLWGLAGSRGPQLRLALVSLALLVR